MGKIVIKSFSKNNKETVPSSTKILMTVANFKSSTSLNVLLGGKRRSNEKIIKFVEGKLAYINKIQKEKPKAALGADAILAVAEMYYAIDRWLVLAARGDSSVNTRRKDGMSKLYAQVVKLLCIELEMGVNQLPNWLEEKFTVAMTDHGYEVDFQNRSALYYKPEDREVYRLKITNGVVYQKKWWDSKNSTSWVKMNSEFTQSTGSQHTISAKHSGYVLSVSGDFYSGPHKSGTLRKEDGQFHSSYMGGKPVLCAGEIEIVNGKIKHLNTGSGHYGPAKGYLLNVINALAIAGVDPASFKVNYHGCKTAFTGAAMRKKIEQEQKVGGDDVSHHRSGISWRYKNTVKGRLLERIKDLESQLKAINHFKDGSHVEGFRKSGGSTRPKCSICYSARLYTKSKQQTWKNKPTAPIELKIKQLQKQVDFIK
jgi:hypothetical protein